MNWKLLAGCMSYLAAIGCLALHYHWTLEMAQPGQVLDLNSIKWLIWLFVVFSFAGSALIVNPFIRFIRWFADFAKRFSATPLNRVVCIACAALAAGSFLTLSGVLARDFARSGTSFFLFIYSSPAALLGITPPVLLCSIIMWTLLGVLLGTATHPIGRAILFLVLLTHYAAIPFEFILHQDDSLGWSNFRAALAHSGPILLMSIGVYVFAQIFFWRAIIRGRVWPDSK